jgi:hypothetical protein
MRAGTQGPKYAQQIIETQIQRKSSIWIDQGKESLMQSEGQACPGISNMNRKPFHVGNNSVVCCHQSGRKEGKNNLK